jgi:hypothetical protein
VNLDLALASIPNFVCVGASTPAPRFLHVKTCPALLTLTRPPHMSRPGVDERIGGSDKVDLQDFTAVVARAFPINP